MKIILRIGDPFTREVDEKHEFSTPEEFKAFMKKCIPVLTEEHYEEILSSPDTQFELDNQWIEDPCGQAAYLGKRRYEIEVKA